MDYVTADRLEHPERRIVSYCGKTFRRLEPEYFAWLHRQMEVARANQEGMPPDATWYLLQIQFDAIEAQALQDFGKDALDLVVRSMDQRFLEPIPPRDASNWTYPAEGNWYFRQPVSRQALANVQAVRDYACAMEWSEARLWQNRGRFPFPVGSDYGLVCYLDGDCEINSINPEFIEVYHRTPSRLTAFLLHNDGGIDYLTSWQS